VVVSMTVIAVFVFVVVVLLVKYAQLKAWQAVPCVVLGYVLAGSEFAGPIHSLIMAVLGD
jgi:hypothetical protein